MLLLPQNVFLPLSNQPGSCAKYTRISQQMAVKRSQALLILRFVVTHTLRLMLFTPAGELLGMLMGFLNAAMVRLMLMAVRMLRGYMVLASLVGMRDVHLNRWAMLLCYLRAIFFAATFSRLLQWI